MKPQPTWKCSKRDLVPSPVVTLTIAVVAIIATVAACKSMM